MAKSIKAFEKDMLALQRACSDPRTMHQCASFIRDRAKLSAPAGVTGMLRNSVGYTIVTDKNYTTALIGTNLEYAFYVEFGTGPKGLANHAGVSPDVSVTYRAQAWWVHESQLDPDAVKRYKWAYVDTKKGRFYRMYGQPAQPFLYPAVKDNEKVITNIIERGITRALG